MHRYYLIDAPLAPSSVSPQIVEVTARSQKRLRAQVERFARYFLREMKTGSIQFEAAELETSLGYVPYRAFLFTYQGHFVGAACFRHRDDQDAKTPWLFDWLWIHPFCRRRGLLTAAWPDLNTRVGPFRLAEPVSLHMQNFLQKVHCAA